MVRGEAERERLERLTAEDAYSDELFEQARKLGRDFQAGLGMLFFETDPKLTETTQHYGVF